MPTKHIHWITGWGVPADWWRPAATRLLPEAEHCFHLPGPQLEAGIRDADAVIAWSLGALYLIDAATGGERLPRRLILLSPFLAFCSEHGRGGKCALPQLKWLKRWIERDREAALTDFYERAGIVGADPAQAPGADVLIGGLQRLERGVNPEADAWGLRSLQGRTVLVGDQDRLLHADRVAETFAGSVVVAGAGHSAIDLLQACPEVWDAL